MDKQFKNLKEEINEDLLNHIQFKEHHKDQVLRSIKAPKGKPIRQPLFKNRFGAVLSFSVVTLMFTGISYYVGTQLQLFNDEKESVSEKPVDVKQIDEKPEDQESIYTPPKQEEYYEDMTKEEILTKMINTVDHFETARGEYKIHYSFQPGYEEVEYAIILKHQPGGYSKATNNSGEVYREYYHNGKAWSLVESLKTYLEYQVMEGGLDTGTTLTLDQAFSIASDGNPLTNYRERPPISRVAESLFPYEIASNYTRDLNRWEIEKQNEELLGHNTLVIKGTKNHRDFQSFRFWVDKDTGVLVKYETYNAAGEVVDYLHPTRLEINVPIDSQEFVPNLEGYNAQENQFEVEVDPREEEVDHVAGTKSSTEINEVYTLMKKDMPFLYEFTHKDLTLISASYETFRDYKIGYLYYSLDPDKDNNSSQMLSVRVHHKDSYVRKNGDFEMIGETIVSPFEQSGIKWEGTSKKESDVEWVHLIGEKGDYIYDVVSQNISIDKTRDFLKVFKAVN